MESKHAIAAFAALAHETRLDLFRLLVRAGEDGMAAGDIAAALETAPSTLSHHLAQLERAELIASRRESRHIYYAIAVPAVRGLLGYLMENCCDNRPELCGIMAVPKADTTC